MRAGVSHSNRQTMPGSNMGRSVFRAYGINRACVTVSNMFLQRHRPSDSLDFSQGFGVATGPFYSVLDANSLRQTEGFDQKRAFGSVAGGAGEEPGAAGGGGGGIQYVYRLAGAVDGAVSWFT